LPLLARRVLAVFAGLGVSIGVILGIEGVSSAIHRPPPGLDWTDVDQIRAFVGGLPLSAFLMVLAAWVLGTFAGASVALRVARERPALYACVIGCAVGAGAVLNLMRLPHPAWMPFGALIGIPLATWAAVRFAPNSPAAPRVG
jgi:pimeloyl-ACP methyl ester carboxylesterase